MKKTIIYAILAFCLTSVTAYAFTEPISFGGAAYESDGITVNYICRGISSIEDGNPIIVTAVAGNSETIIQIVDINAEKLLRTFHTGISGTMWYGCADSDGNVYCCVGRNLLVYSPDDKTIVNAGYVPTTWSGASNGIAAAEDNTVYGVTSAYGYVYSYKTVSYTHLYIMLAPFLLWFVLFYYYPMYGIQVAFRDYQPYTGILNSTWVGLKHFKNFLSSPYAFRVIRNTFLINIYSLIFVFPASIILALLLNELRSKRFTTFVSTVSYLPYFVSTVVVAGLVVTFLSPTAGIINVLIEKIGFERQYFLTKPEYFRTIYIAMTAWQGVGLSLIHI